MTYRQLHEEACRRCGWSEEKIAKAQLFADGRMKDELGEAGVHPIDMEVQCQPGKTIEDAINAMVGIVKRIEGMTNAEVGIVVEQTVSDLRDRNQKN